MISVTCTIVCIVFELYFLHLYFNRKHVRDEANVKHGLDYCILAMNIARSLQTMKIMLLRIVTYVCISQLGIILVNW